MLFTVLCVVVTITLAKYFYSFIFDKSQNLPPGVPRLPIWGSYWIFLYGNYNFPHKMSWYYKNKYKSKLISCYFGSALTVVATDYDSIKELLTKPEFDGRLSNSYTIKARFGGKKAGIFFTDGSVWTEQRRFAIRHMRDFGFGRRLDKLEHEFADEIKTLIDIMKCGAINEEELSVIKDGKGLFPNIFYPVASNLLLAIFTGERLSRADHGELRELAKSTVTFLRTGNAVGSAILHTPWLRHVSHIFGFSKIVGETAKLFNFMKKNFVRCETTYVDGEARGFMDRYVEKLKNSGGGLSSFSEDQLASMGTDLVIPSLAAVPFTLAHFIKFMMHHPRVLAKVQNEIDTVVGRDRLVNLNDRVNMPYTEATIREAMRAQLLAPWGIPHRAMEEAELCGYTIPKNTVLIADLWSLHNDPDRWGDPENFRPERFLTEHGELDKDRSLPFGIGGRRCAGETFARQIVFLAFTGVVQNFNFDFVQGEPSSMEDNIPGILTGPKELWIKLVPRVSPNVEA